MDTRTLAQRVHACGARVARLAWLGGEDPIAPSQALISMVLGHPVLARAICRGWGIPEQDLYPQGGLVLPDRFLDAAITHDQVGFLAEVIRPNTRPPEPDLIYAPDLEDLVAQIERPWPWRVY